MFLSPSPADKYVPAIVICVIVRHPNCARMWRTIPMPRLPNPTITGSPNPDSPDPHKIGAWYGRHYVHLHGRWSSRNFHLGGWRSDLNVTAGNKKSRHDGGQNNRFEQFSFHKTLFLVMDKRYNFVVLLSVPDRPAPVATMPPINNHTVLFVEVPVTARETSETAEW
jgi:hypothetical protein